MTDIPSSGTAPCLCPPGHHPYSTKCLKPEHLGRHVTPRYKLLGHACHDECAVPCPWAEVEEQKRKLAEMTEDRDWHRNQEKRLRDAIWEFGLTGGPGSDQRQWASEALYGG